jgi:hypothetical protein
MHLMPISPSQGTTSGGTSVTITGTNLANATAVYFGLNLATAITANTATSVTVVSPAGSGVVEASVTASGGISNPVPFYYVQPPFTDDISSRSGPTGGGNTVTLSGANLTTATSVKFGATSVTPTVVNDGVISVIVPAGAAGSVSVSVTTAGGTDGLPDSYTYVAVPTLITVSPASGLTGGGTFVSLTGTGLSTTTSVTFDGVPANFGVISDTFVSVDTPPGAAGTANVAVTTAAGTATATAGFTYVAGPGI